MSFLVTPPSESPRLQRLCGSLVLAIGLLIALGWVADWQAARNFRPHTPETNMNAAVCLILAGAGLLALTWRLLVVARVLGGLLTLLSAVITLEMLSGWPAGVNRLFWLQHDDLPLWVTGRLAPHAAVAFLAVGLTFALAGSRRTSQRTERWVAGFLIGTGALALLHYVVITTGWAGVEEYRNMALPTALGLVLLGVGLYLRLKDWWPTKGPQVLAGVALGSFFSTGIFLVLGNQQLVDANRLVTRAQEARVTINSLVSHLAQMESAAGAHALTGSETAANRVPVHVAEIERQLAALPPLLHDVSAQKELFEEMQFLSAGKIAAAKKLIALRDEQGLAAAAAFLASQPPERAGRLAALAERILVAEEASHRRHLHLQTVLERNVRVIFGIGGLLMAATVAGTTMLSIRSSRARIRAEQSLQEVNELQRAVLDGGAFGVVATGLDGTIKLFSQGAVKMLGYSVGEMVGRKAPEGIFVPEEVAARATELSTQLGRQIEPGFEALVARARLGGADECEWTFVRKDGTRMPVQFSVTALRDKAGVITGFMGIAQDLTERKRARDEALTAARLKSEFLANVSHEIRTPMNGVLGMADLLMDTHMTEDQRQMGRVIQSSARNLLTLIDDLLDFSKIEAGKFRLTTEAFSLAEQVDQALALMVPRAVSGEVSLESDLPADIPALLNGDPGRIHQVLVNLLGNAVKFTEKGTVAVTVRSRPALASGNYAFRVEVRDTGIGIDATQQSRLFQPFMQADGSSTRRFGGTGLGLAISRQLIELMGGRIGVESAPGRGSIFWFELELPIAAEPTSTPSIDSQPLAASPAARILVAEDQPANQLFMRLLLTKLGIEFTVVGDGQAAIEELGKRDYALVLMDCQMPKMDGYEATRLIRTGAAGLDREGTPIVALTAHAMAADREKCITAGMDDYLTKPIKVDALQAILQRLGVVFTPSAQSAAAEPARPVARVLDEAQLEQLRSLPGRNSPSLLEELIAMALQDIPPALAELHRNVQQQAAKAAAQNAHRLAGSAANLGAVTLRTILAEIEKAAGDGDWALATQRLDGLDREWNAVQQAFRDLLPKDTP